MKKVVVIVEYGERKATEAIEEIAKNAGHNILVINEWFHSLGQVKRVAQKIRNFSPDVILIAHVLSCDYNGFALFKAINLGREKFVGTSIVACWQKGYCKRCFPYTWISDFDRLKKEFLEIIEESQRDQL